MQVKFKKLHEKATLPVYSSNEAAGMDITCVDYDWDWDETAEIISYKTGIAVEIPKGYAGFIFPRSSIRKVTLSLANSVGVVDSDYRGEIIASFRKTKEDDSFKRYEVGERCCQLIILPVPRIDPVFVDELSDTVRGEGGFGSTGK